MGGRGSRTRMQQGFTLVEVLVAATLSSVGIAATIGVFGSSHKASIMSQQREVAVQQAQATIDRVQLMDYTDLALSTQPAYDPDPNSPFNRVSGSNLNVKPGLSEPLVVDTNAGQVFTGPERFTVGSGGAQISGYLYRFITWRDENCPTGTCDGTENTKRLTVAVTIDASGTLPARPPLWISSVTADPSAAPPGSDLPPDANPGSGSGASAQTWFLYDTRCSQTQRATISGEHTTHDTASTGPAAIDYSTCENADLTKRPDLMGTTPAPGDGTTPLYKYSSDLTATYPGGLVMKKRNASCPTSYLATDSQNPDATSRWNVHTWATNSFSTTFNLTDQVVVQMYTQTVDGVAASGTVCATLIDRSVSGGVPTDTVLGSTTYENVTWPTSPTPVTFSWNLSSQANLSANHRLLLVLSVREESTADLVFLYDHPSYASFLQVATTTPLP
ncbi:MAG: type II secretion system protein [Phycisphaeraceae bacterium]